MIVLAGGLVDRGRDGFARTDVVIDDGIIGAIGERPRDDAEVVDCSGRLIVAGLVNAHFHSSENWFKGRFDTLPLEPWMLYSYPAALAPVQDADEIRTRTLLGATTLLAGGTTCVVDFLYELAGMTTESLDAVVAAYREAGLRALIVLGMSDLSWTQTVILDPAAVPSGAAAALAAEPVVAWPEWEAFARDAVARHHRPEEGIAIALGPSGPQRCSDEMLAGSAALAAELDLLVHMHVLETPMQTQSGRRRWGTTLPAALDALGALSPATCFEHAIWLTEDDIELMAARGVRVVHNPVSNLKLGSGACRVRSLRNRGISVGVGTDGASSNDGSNLLEAVKLAALLHRGPDADFRDAWLGADAAWEMATTGGAQTTPWPLGRIAVGAPADLLLLDLRHHALTPLNDPRRQLVYTAAPDAITDVIVAGRWAVRDGRPTGFDRDAVLGAARQTGKDIVRRFARAECVADELLTAVAAGWREVMVR